jgi:hypothetical protein
MKRIIKSPNFRLIVINIWVLLSSFTLVFAAMTQLPLCNSEPIEMNDIYNTPDLPLMDEAIQQDLENQNNWRCDTRRKVDMSSLKSIDSKNLNSLKSIGRVFPISKRQYYSDTLDTIAGDISLDHIGQGTGFLVNQCLVLTNYHVAISETLKREDQGYQYIQFPGLGKNIRAKAKILAVGSFGEGLVLRSEKKLGTNLGDWALLQISAQRSQMPKDLNSILFQFFKLNFSQPKAGVQVVWSIGFPFIFGVQNEADTAHLIKTYAKSHSGYFQIKGIITGGASGSPLMMKGSNGEIQVVGLVSQSNPYIDPLNPSEEVDVSKDAKVSSLYALQNGILPYFNPSKNQQGTLEDIIKKTPCEI